MADTATYEKLPKNSTPKLLKQVNRDLRVALLSSGLDASFANRFITPETVRTHKFYVLPKTHKSTLKTRPIVSAKGGIFDRLGWLLQNILKPLLTKLSAHISNTEQLINTFDKTTTQILQGRMPISFDVVYLYTNIGIEEVVDTVLHNVDKYHLDCFGISQAILANLLNLALNNNVLSYQDDYHRHIRG